MKHTVDSKYSIEEGQFIMYRPLKFNFSNPSKFKKFLRKLQKDKFVFSDISEDSGIKIKDSYLEYYNNLLTPYRNHLAENLNKTISDFSAFINSPINFESDLIDFSDYTNSVDFSIDYDRGSIFLNLQHKDISCKISHIDTFVLEIESGLKVYSSKFFNEIHNFLLPNIKFKCGDTWSYYNVMLQVFNNHMAILKVSIPLKDEQLNSYYDKNYISKYKEYYLPQFILDPNSNDLYYTLVKDIDNIYDLMRYYLNYINYQFEVSFITDNEVCNISISKLNPIIKDLNNADNILKEDIFRILNAPTIPILNIKKESQELWNKYWGRDETRYFFSVYGKSIAFMSDNLIQKHKANIKDIIKERDINIYEYMSVSLEQDLSYPLYLILLKHLNMVSMYELSKSNIDEMVQRKNEYIETEIYLADIMEGFYGSAIELYEYMKDAMKLYLNETNLNMKFKNLEFLVNTEKNNNEKTRQKITGAIIFLITIFFTLPIIRDSLDILLSILSNYEREVSQEISERYSIILWGCLITILGIGGLIIIRKDIKRKYTIMLSGFLDNISKIKFKVNKAYNKILKNISDFNQKIKRN